MENDNKKYLILENQKILQSFDDPVEAIRTHRTNYGTKTKVVRLEQNGSYTLLAQNKKLSLK